MSAVSFIAVMLIGVIAANVIKEFFPKISETFILIGVGILLSFLPEFRHFELEPEFFMMLIIDISYGIIDPRIRLGKDD